MTVFARGSVAIAMLLNLIVISRFLGSAVLGQISLVILNMAIVHTFAEIYSGSALVYFIPRHSLASIYRRGLAWIAICALTVNFVLLLLEPSNRELGVHVTILSMLSAVHIFHNFLLLGREKMRIYNFLVFFQPACNIALLTILVFIFDVTGVQAPLMALYGSYGLSFLISFFAVIVTVRDCNISNTINTAEVLKLGFLNQMGNLSHMLSNRFNYYIIGALGMEVLGLYSGSTQLIESVWVISAGISPVVLTHIANTRDDNNASFTLRLARVSFILTAVCVLIIYLVPTTVYMTLFGDGFAAAKGIMIYLSPGVLAIGFSSIISHYFSGLGAQKIQLAANASGVALTLMLSYFAVTHYGLKGACLVASGAYIVQALVLVIVFMKKNQIPAKAIIRLKS